MVPTQDYDTSHPGRHRYRNDPRRWLVQFRERETVTYAIWNRRDAARTGRRTVTRWTPWKTNRRFLTADEAWAHYDHCVKAGLAQWRVTWGGKVQRRNAIAKTEGGGR